MSSALPPEVWVSIVSFVASDPDGADLFPLLTVSRQMHAYAELELLRNVNLLVDDASDDSRSPVIQFHLCTSAPNDYRQRFVKSLDVCFDEEPSRNEVQALEQLIPTLSSLHSLSLYFTRYQPSKHGHLSLFEEGIYNLSLRDLQVSVSRSDTRLDITGLLRSQPAVNCLAISGSIAIPDTNDLLPQLRSLKASLDTPQRGFSLDGIVHLSTFFDVHLEMVPRTPVHTLTTLSCSAPEPTTFRVFLPMVPNLRYLEIYLDDEPDMELLAPLRHTKITHLRCPYRVAWIIRLARSKELFAFDAFPPSLRCVEVALSPQPGYSSPCSLRWRRRRCSRFPDTITWNCKEEEIWFADWERDVRNIPDYPFF